MSKSQPTPPPAPDPTVVANAQTGTNVSTAVANRALNNTNQVTPYGSTTYSQSGGYTDPSTGQFVPQYTQDTSLTPLGQSILTGTEGVANSLIPTAQHLSDAAATSTATPLNFSGTNNDIIMGGPQALNQNATTAAYNAQKTFLDPQWAQQQKDLGDQLSRQGIPVGSDAYNSAMTNFNNSKSQAYGAAANTAVGQGETAANSMFGLALQGQNQNINQQKLAQSNPLTLLNAIYGGTA